MKLVALPCLALFSLGFATPAAAGPATDTLSTCLVQHTSPADRQLLVRWIFAAMASHPDVKDMSAVKPEVARKLNQDTGALFQDLVVERCRAETTAAFAADGQAAINGAFEVLGKVATQGLMGDPKVDAFIAGMAANLDPAKLAEVLGGAPAAPAPASPAPAPGN
jgi:hypothetical protein